MAGVGGGATIGAAWRGWGTILRGAGAAATGAAGDGTETGRSVAGAGAAATGVAGFAGAGAAAGGATATGATETGRGGGAAASSFFCWIAFRTSPGFETLDQSIFGLGAAASPRALPAPPDLARWKCARTRSASSSSSELECVFFSITPTLSRTSRIALLLTSSSRAKSLIRTLLIRPFLFLPHALSYA